MISLDEAIAAAREAAADMAVRESFYGVAKLIRTGEEAWTASAIDSFAADYREALAKAQQWKQLAEDQPAAMRRELAAKDAEIDRLKAAAIPDGKPTPEQALKMAKALMPGAVCVVQSEIGYTHACTVVLTYDAVAWTCNVGSGGRWFCLGEHVDWGDLPASRRIYPAHEKPLAVGDWVMHGDSTEPERIVAISDNRAWVRRASGGHYSTWFLDRIRRATTEEIEEIDDEN